MLTAVKPLWGQALADRMSWRILKPVTEESPAFKKLPDFGCT
jgi:hypothetical protein